MTRIDRVYLIALFIVSALILAGLAAVAIDDESGPFRDARTQWIGVSPVDEATLDGDEESISHDDERISDLEFLQRALEEAARTNEGVSVEISQAELNEWVESTRTTDRLRGEPGLLVRYDGEVFRAQVVGLA